MQVKQRKCIVNINDKHATKQATILAGRYLTDLGVFPTRIEEEPSQI